MKVKSFVKGITRQNENHSSIKDIKEKIAMYDQFILFFEYRALYPQQNTYDTRTMLVFFGEMLKCIEFKNLSEQEV